MEYLWTKEADLPHYKALDGDATTDVLIIGGGMAGILCAMELEREGIDYMLVEARNIGGGITKGTTAVVSAQHDTLYSDMISKFGKEKAKLYLDANLNAVEKFRKLSGNIACDFEDTPAIMYSLDDKKKIEDEVKAVRSLGFNAEFTTSTPLPFKVAGAEIFPGMAQFHPLKFLGGAAKGLKIYENTFIEKVKGTIAYTRRGETIKAKKIIVTTHFPFINSYGLYFMKLYQKRSFVIAVKNAPRLDCSIMDCAEDGIYLRNYGELLIIGGGDRRPGKKGSGFAVVRDFKKRYFPEAVEVYAWANQDCMSLDGAPYIGPYCPLLPNVYVASGFNEWGMTSSMVAAEILSDMVRGKENRFAPVFSPTRNIFRTQLLSNMGAAVTDLIYPSTKRCPHMGCSLHWNEEERSWDCPCHGSRFDENGRLIDNPAKRDSRV